MALAGEGVVGGALAASGDPGFHVEFSALAEGHRKEPAAMTGVDWV